MTRAAYEIQRFAYGILRALWFALRPSVLVLSYLGNRHRFCECWVFGRNCDLVSAGIIRNLLAREPLGHQFWILLDSHNHNGRCNRFIRSKPLDRIQARLGIR